MILADTSVWVEHLRRPLRNLQDALGGRRLVMHPFVIGELVCGSLPDRARFILALHELPTIDVAAHETVVRLVESRKLMGLGLGWIDAHLLASALQEQHSLWTFDKRMSAAAEKIGVELTG